MKTKPAFILGAVIVATLAIALFFGLAIDRGEEARSMQDSARLVAAVQNYSRDRATKRLPLPASVSLRELVTLGYLKTEDVRVFEGMAVSVFLGTNSGKETETLMRARQPDGSVMELLRDGSIQQGPR
jgi:hypothetical protein